ncbi:hypothetical protein [Botrimarina hoheduenensis]|uniref:Uncharacterized protein n=1 Tax=Botrimarina hoheduenensis TaxID=2528000 RepID=A0A5C5WCC4_9BACT|nr:hypothetical protein [Botrimarina hoheduenensis]TWT48566.1 hypothetical protein Pla111_03400 [Botrimarina hoheduenensis]
MNPPPAAQTTDNQQAPITGLDIAVRRWATPVALGLGIGLTAYTFWRATLGEKAGGVGSVLVLLLVATMGLKLAAETVLFSSLGGDATPRQAAARALIGPLSRWTTLRYVLGCFGGVILPLGAQILMAGAKNIPPVLDPTAPAVLVGVSLACLVPAELLERWLWRRSQALAAAEDSAPVAPVA